MRERNACASHIGRARFCKRSPVCKRSTGPALARHMSVTGG
jgi:hypothetical protein